MSKYFCTDDDGITGIGNKPAEAFADYGDAGGDVGIQYLTFYKAEEIKVDLIEVPKAPIKKDPK